MKCIRFYVTVFLLSITFLGCNTNPNNNPGEESSSRPLFNLLESSATGIDFQNRLTEGLNTNILMYEYFYNGGGVAAADFNGDGLCDLYFTSNMSDNKLYLNEGNLHFRDVTSISGASGRPGPWKTGVNAVDINGDGKLDIYICYSGALPADKRANQLFINTGNGTAGVPHFTEQAEEYGLASTGYSNQSYFFDFDRDGDLDMLLLNHNPKNLPVLNLEATAKQFEGDDTEKGLRLFEQENGKFTDVTKRAGLNGSELSYGLGIGVGDFNNDGWPDFYVSNDYSVPDFLYINNQKGGFENDLNKSIGHTSQFSMGNDVADINNDGFPDIFTLDMLPEDNRRQKLLLPADNFDKFDLNVKSGFYYQYMRNMLQVNNGNGTFSEVGQQSDISNTDWSWAALLADFDNDGWKDAFVTNGYFRDYTNQDFIKYMNSYVQEKGRLQREDVMGIIKEMPSSNVVNYIFRNQGRGTFAKENKTWGITQPSNSNGAAYADLDNDGDLDLIVNNINQPAFIYQNLQREKDSGHFISVILRGEKMNTQGVGASVSISAGALLQEQSQYNTRGYLSCVSNVLHFGLGKIQTIDSLSVTWPDGKRQVLKNVKADQTITLSAKDAAPFAKASGFPPPIFSLIKSPIQFKDSIAPVNDFNRQQLLICGQSFEGPCSATGDLNGDGLMDVVIGGEAGMPTSIFLQTKDNGFKRLSSPALESDRASEDAGIAIFDANSDGKPDIYVAEGGYNNFHEADPLFQDRLYLNTGEDFQKAALPPLLFAKSCVATGDVNGDGYTDIFLGGRTIPAKYPESSGSVLLINDGKGNFSDQTRNLCPQLLSIGLTNDAAFADLDGDHKSELIVAGEWMPVRIFGREGKGLQDVSSRYLDSSYSGWWNTVAVADLNGDNLPDMVFGNMGLNTQFHASTSEPLELYYKDFDDNGTIDPIFTYYIDHRKYPYITRDELITQMPGLRKKFPDYKSYADATINDLFPESELKSAKHLEATEMHTMCFINQGKGKMKPMKLPPEAQYSPVYSIQTGDFSGDGKTDLLLFGNNSHFKIRLGKFDANYGQLFAGNGRGDFNYVPQYLSGLNTWGDVRSTFFIDDLLFVLANGKEIMSYQLKLNR